MSFRKLIRSMKKDKTDWDEIKWWLQDHLWYNWIGWLRVKHQMLQRMFFWGWKMRWSWDFDAATTYDMLYLKFDRIHDCMKNYGHLMWNSREDTKLMKRLCEAKYIAKKLSEEHRFNRYYRTMSEKYSQKGDRGGILSKFNFYPNAKPINSKLYRVFLRKAMDKDNAEQRYYRRRLYYLMEKYMDSWWD